ncbi:hypothetical protein [Paenibacillus tengchongensis]|uniref:hypothetical protein n=1 Tax=Paenibacillus tengchongensis TaxID=2608684 RepID=UPI00124BF836|nr:hypothetical protein [Paenibacillus tengchongensis]
MLDELNEWIKTDYGSATRFMGLAFKFKRGIALIDHYTAEDDFAGFKLEWVSFADKEDTASVICMNKEELQFILKELAL